MRIIVRHYAGKPPKYGDIITADLQMSDDYYNYPHTNLDFRIDSVLKTTRLDDGASKLVGFAESDCLCTPIIDISIYQRL